MNPLASEFFAALTDLLTAADPQPAPVAARKPACRGCGGTGDMPSGRACNWCEAWNPQAGDDDLPGDLEDY
jgi:hypothetical protein